VFSSATLAALHGETLGVRYEEKDLSFEFFGCTMGAEERRLLVQTSHATVYPSPRA